MGLDLAPEALRALWGVDPGQLWTIRGARGTTHRLLVGDCRRAEDVARLMAGAHANVAFTSPPYASQRTYDEASGFKPIAPERYPDWFEPVQANVRRHLAPDGSWFVNIRAGCLHEAIASGTPQDESLATWEPSWDRAPLRRPDLLLLADGR